MKLVKIQTLLFVLLFGILSLGAFSVNYVTADSHDDDVEDDEREVYIETGTYEVYIESENAMDGREDAFSASMSSYDITVFDIAYSSENDTTEAEAEMTVEFHGLVEFFDENSDGVYNDSVDTVIQTYDPSESGYKPIVYTTQERTEGTEHIITTETNDGVMKIVVHIVGQMTNIDGTDLKPTSLKIDIFITGFNFSQTDTKLALHSEIESTSEVEMENNDVDDQIESDEEVYVERGEGIFAFYSWKNTADVDGTTTDVLHSFVENSPTEHILYLNYEQGQDIVHDPKLGVSISSGAIDGGTDNTSDADKINDRPIEGFWPDISQVSLFTISVVATVIALTIPVYMYRKKN